MEEKFNTNIITLIWYFIYFTWGYSTIVIEGGLEKL